jgi:hypothetical protein
MQITNQYRVARTKAHPFDREKIFVLVFTDGSAASVTSRSAKQAKNLMQGALDQFGTPRKIKSVRETR